MTIVTIVSIWMITALAWLVKKFLSIKVCPVCAGVSGTWLWMLAARFFGYQVDPVALAMLLGGSVVGIAYQVEKRLPHGRSPFIWKLIFIPVGFAAAYGLVLPYWEIFVASSFLLIMFTVIFLRPSNHQSTAAKRAVEELEDRMKDCC